MRWIWRGIALAALLIGWLFIAWQNRFHITAPVVFVCLGYLAVVATIHNLWRTGAAAVATSDGEGDSTWAKPAGARGELEREKRTLIKAIKEAEFDHQMGKLSQRDADDMIHTYRARAVEVLKEIDRLELGSAGSPREQILREVRARLEIDAKAHKKAVSAPKPGAKAGADKGEDAKGKQPPLTSAADTDGAATAPPEADKADEADEAGAAAPTATEPAGAADAPGESSGDSANHLVTPTAAPVANAIAKAVAKVGADAVIDDEAMDADSTTAVEPKREDPAKEATP